MCPDVDVPPPMGGSGTLFKDQQHAVYVLRSAPSHAQIARPAESCNHLGGVMSQSLGRTRVPVNGP